MYNNLYSLMKAKHQASLRPKQIKERALKAWAKLKIIKDEAQPFDRPYDLLCPTASESVPMSEVQFVFCFKVAVDFPQGEENSTQINAHFAKPKHRSVGRVWRQHRTRVDWNEDLEPNVTETDPSNEGPENLPAFTVSQSASFEDDI